MTFVLLGRRLKAAPSLQAFLAALAVGVLGAEAAQAQVTLLNVSYVARLRLDLQQPLAAGPYATNRETGSLVLIDPVTHRTVAAGIVAA